MSTSENLYIGPNRVAKRKGHPVDIPSMATSAALPGFAQPKVPFQNITSLRL